MQGYLNIEVEMSESELWTKLLTSTVLSIKHGTSCDSITIVGENGDRLEHLTHHRCKINNIITKNIHIMLSNVPQIALTIHLLLIT